MGRLRIPFTTALPPPRIYPPTATQPDAAARAIAQFLIADGSSRSGSKRSIKPTVLLTGAGISTPSGISDYRSARGTYTLNPHYVPIFYAEFCRSHPSRRRYWARSFLGWPLLAAAQADALLPPSSPHKHRRNTAYEALTWLQDHAYLSGGTITQNVDSLHLPRPTALPTPAGKVVTLHGELARVVCLHCGDASYARNDFQRRLEDLNPEWARLLEEMTRTGALQTEDPAEKAARGLKTNADGDVEVAGWGTRAYERFRYPPCPTCVGKYGTSTSLSSTSSSVRVDADGAFVPHPSSATMAVLKPGVVMFGESVDPAQKQAAEALVDGAGRLLVVGSSLATYSAWRLAKRARDAGKAVGIVNLGGVRGEEAWFGVKEDGEDGASSSSVPGDGGANIEAGGVRVEMPAEVLLPMVVDVLRGGSV